MATLDYRPFRPCDSGKAYMCLPCVHSSFLVQMCIQKALETVLVVLFETSKQKNDTVDRHVFNSNRFWQVWLNAKSVTGAPVPTFTLTAGT